MDMYLRAKFEVSSIILTSFRQGGRVILKSPPRLGLSSFNPGLQLKDAESAIKSKVIKLLTQLISFSF